MTTLTAPEMPHASLFLMYILFNAPIAIIINRCIVIGREEPGGPTSHVLMYSDGRMLPFAFNYEIKNADVPINVREKESFVNPNVNGILLTLTAIRVPIMAVADYLALCTAVQIFYGTRGKSDAADSLIGAVLATADHFAVLIQIAVVVGCVFLWFEVPNYITYTIWYGSTRAVTAEEVATKEKILVP